MTRRPGTWIFGYGSLMWDPGFDHLEAQPALLHGFHRALCLYSWHYRGTRERPGLVLGLDRGGSCRGRAFRVAAGRLEEVLDYLHRREMLHYVYDPRWLGVRLADGRAVKAFTYTIVRACEQYAGRPPLDEAARLVGQGNGVNGSNVEYLENTVAHLDELGIADGPLHELLAKLREGSGAGPDAGPGAGPDDGATTGPGGAAERGDAGGAP